MNKKQLIKKYGSIENLSERQALQVIIELLLKLLNKK